MDVAYEKTNQNIFVAGDIGIFDLLRNDVGIAAVIDGSLLEIDPYANPSGSRNLEFDPSRQIQYAPKAQPAGENARACRGSTITVPSALVSGPNPAG